MRFKTGLLFIVLLAACRLALPAMAADGVSDPAIDRWIRAQADRMKGSELKEARYAVIGDLDGDGRNDVAVLYTIEGVRKGDYWLRYLAAFRRGPHALEYRAHTLVGGKGIREVDRATILRRTIVLEALEYRPSDAMCCPSRPAKWRYRLSEDKLIPVRNSRPKPAKSAPAAPRK